MSSSASSSWSKVLTTGIVPRVLISVSITLLFVLLGSGYGPAWAVPLYKNSLIRNGVLIVAAIFSRIFIGEGMQRKQGTAKVPKRTEKTETIDEKEEKKKQ